MFRRLSTLAKNHDQFKSVETIHGYIDGASFSARRRQRLTSTRGFDRDYRGIRAGERGRERRSWPSITRPTVLSVPINLPSMILASDSAHLCQPTRPDAIQPKCLLRIAEMAVRDHIRHTMDLQHQTGCNHAWGWLLPSGFIHNRDRALFSHRCREASKPAGGSMAQTRGIGKGERGEYDQISIDGGCASQNFQNTRPSPAGHPTAPGVHLHWQRSARLPHSPSCGSAMWDTAGVSCRACQTTSWWRICDA